MNSDYGYANFKKGKTYISPYGQGGGAGGAAGGATTPISTARSKKTKTYMSPYGQGTPKAKALKGTPAAPTLREPGIARNARSTAAGAKQGARDLTGWAGKRGIRSNIAGAKQGARDAAYAGTQTLKKAGRFVMKNKVGVGLAAAGALGAAGGAIALKMRNKKKK